jgi:hypothetical protein
MSEKEDPKLQRFIEINGLWFEIIPPKPWPAVLPELTPEEMCEAAQRYIDKRYREVMDHTSLGEYRSYGHTDPGDGGEPDEAS